MAPLTATLLSSLEEVIDQIPDQTQSFRSQTQGQIRKRSKERTVFRRFLAKLSGDDKNDQIAFLINQAQKISRRTYVKVALHSIQKPPDYATLQKRSRETHAHIYQLIDEILPIAAGSTSLISQMRVFENRWKFLHNESFFESKVKALSNPVNL